MEIKNNTNGEVENTSPSFTITEGTETSGTNQPQQEQPSKNDISGAKEIPPQNNTTGSIPTNTSNETYSEENTITKIKRNINNFQQKLHEKTNKNSENNKRKQDKQPTPQDPPKTAQDDGSPQNGKQPYKDGNMGTPHRKGVKSHDETSDICGAKNKRGGICQARAGFGTNHVGSGRCKFHGGASTGAPKGNKNALKHGEYESFYYDLLTEDEKVVYHQERMEKQAQAEMEIKLLSIRERRMLERINELKDLIEDGEQYVEADYSHRTGGNGNLEGGLVDMVTQKREHIHNRLLNFEQALTRVQNVKAKMIELLHKMEVEKGNNDNGALDQLAAVLERARQQYDVEEPEGDD